VDTQAVTGTTRIPLLEVVPSLAGYLPPDGQDLARRLTVHVSLLPRGDVDPRQLLDDAGAFAAVVVDGLLMHRMAIGEQPALRLLGPGDILSTTDGSRPFLIAHSSYRAAAAVRLAMLDDRVLWLAQRFPRLFAGLQARTGAQQDRIAVQLAACQLPRVEDRLIAIMWLIAESWGRVTAGGTEVPVTLTHDALGELVGARRSTVSLALKQLMEDGALVRNDGGWLLLRPLQQPVVPGALSVDPALISTGQSAWAQTAIPEPSFDPAQLSALVHEMAESHRRNAAAFRNRIDRSQRARARSQALRDEIVSRRRRRRPAP
jgi:CRP/FNR family transcriptional regulator, cyclic AMP receptor protein